MQVYEFDQTNRVLEMLSEYLPLLDHLDLSGTNLPGSGFTVAGFQEQNALPGWPPDRMLSFLGLWGCPSGACLREKLPAHRVAGIANEEQLLVALEAYAEHWFPTRRILRTVCKKVAAGNITFHSGGLCLELVLERMQRYPQDHLVQMCGSQLLYSLLCHLHVENISPLRVRTLVKTLVDSLESFPKDHSIVCSSCLTLCEVCTYSQLIFVIERLLKVLLQIADDPPERDDEPPVIEEQFEELLGEQLNAQLMALKLIHVIIGQLSLPDKFIFGDIGGMNLAFSVLYQRLEDDADRDDEIVDICWSAGGSFPLRPPLKTTTAICL